MESVNRFLYGPSPEERVRKWQAKIRTEERQMDREIRGIENAQNKVKIQLKQLAAKNDLKNCKTLAKEIVRSNKQKDRLFTSKARLNSIRMQLQHQLATLKISGTLQKSTEIMKLSNSLMKLPELNKTMQEMSQEMMKAGIMSEMMEDAIDTLDEDEEELEEEAEAEVQNVLFNITDGKLGQMGSVSSKLPQSTQISEPAQENELEDVERMQAQLNGLLQS
ncbi:Vacuolar protein-sorting-associated protein 24 [Puccinia graminis f. sp. tritici]|uniref:Vacuolar protein-sorting-associated protein 24 n=1 Tax=Puccinia graminis f. sp. tritici TaxID=56615 RepID=A0A5B0P2E9_PUCGR|nr:Vacuolar protein-sorting-associated protein 24 [Puccinia graminis f. sp. tritici]KAA1121392.1 Vacuolar protein-sorting-associated protein 24 [Puccinia graminis f. sp. tritici]